MKNLLRQEVIAECKTLIVKIGTNVLASERDSLDEERIATLAREIHAVRESGRRIVLVSSGAVGAGMELLGLTERPADLPRKQAVAAVGQAYLIRLYDRHLQKYGYHAAQMLLTSEDFQDRTRYLNVRNTLRNLFEYGVVPIINENDSVSVDEIKFGDNDQLAAMVTNLLDRPLLVILSVVDGLYDGAPSDPDSRLIPLVEEWSTHIEKFVAEESSRLGTGGMRAKLQAIHKATAVGENVILASGKNDRVISSVLQGEEVGTLFVAQGEFLPAWKRWIGYTVVPTGRLSVDAGAVTAVRNKGKSLLAIGITEVAGEFEMGEVVSIVDPDGHEFARGLCNYESKVLAGVKGLRTEQIAERLGALPFREVVHRDNLVLTKNQIRG